MAIPCDMFAAAAVLVTVGLAALWLAAPRIGHSLQLRIGSAAVLVALVAVGAGAHAAGAPLLPEDQPLAFGHSWSFGDPSLIAVDSRTQSYDFAYSPGAEIRLSITLANNGNAPLTVTGLAPEPISSIRSVDLRLPPGQLNSDLPPAYPNLVAPGSDRWASAPFHPFEIPAKDEVGLVMAVTVGTCSAISPVPTLAPSASLLPATDPSIGGTLTAVGDLPIQYTAFGIARTATIRLPFDVVIVGAPSIFGCPFD
jgi:hypothetical protein